MNRPDPLPEIVQIIPAAGYVAVYRADDGTAFSSPVVMWALVRHVNGRDAYNDVEGLEACNEEGVCRCEESTNWLAYTEAATFKPEEWTRAARAALNS